MILMLSLLGLVAHSAPLPPKDGLFCRGQNHFQVIIGPANPYGERTLRLIEMPTVDGGVYPVEIKEYLRVCEYFCPRGDTLETGFRYGTSFSIYLDEPSIRVGERVYPLTCQTVR